MNELCDAAGYPIQPADRRNDGTVACPICGARLRPSNAWRVPSHQAARVVDTPAGNFQVSP